MAAGGGEQDQLKREDGERRAKGGCGRRAADRGCVRDWGLGSGR